MMAGLREQPREYGQSRRLDFRLPNSTYMVRDAKPVYVQGKQIGVEYGMTALGRESPDAAERLAAKQKAQAAFEQWDASDQAGRTKMLQEARAERTSKRAAVKDMKTQTRQQRKEAVAQARDARRESRAQAREVRSQLRQARRDARAEFEAARADRIINGTPGSRAREATGTQAKTRVAGTTVRSASAKTVNAARTAAGSQQMRTAVSAAASPKTQEAISRVAGMTPNGRTAQAAVAVARAANSETGRKVIGAAAQRVSGSAQNQGRQAGGSSSPDAGVSVHNPRNAPVPSESVNGAAGGSSARAAGAGVSGREAAQGRVRTSQGPVNRSFGTPLDYASGRVDRVQAPQSPNSARGGQSSSPAAKPASVDPKVFQHPKPAGADKYAARVREIEDGDAPNAASVLRAQRAGTQAAAPKAQGPYAPVRSQAYKPTKPGPYAVTKQAAKDEGPELG